MFRWNFIPAMFQLLQPSYFLKYLEEIGPFLPEFSVYNASIVFHSYQSTFLIYNLLTLSIPQIIDYFSLTYGIIVLE